MRLSSYSTRHRHQILAGAATESAGPQMCARTSTKDGTAASGRLQRAPANRKTSQCTSTRALGSCSSVLSHLLEQFSSSQQTTDGRRQRRRPRHGLEKKSQKDGAGTQCSVHSRLLEHTHQAAVIHAVAVVGVSQDFLHFPPASPAFCFIR